MKLKFKGNYINPRERKGVMIRKYIAVISQEKFEINEMLLKVPDSTFCANAHNYLVAGVKCDFEYDLYIAQVVIYTSKTFKGDKNTHAKAGSIRKVGTFW